MKYKTLSKNTLLIVLVMVLITSCEKDTIEAPSAVLSGGAEILAGDSTSVAVNFKGTPPFGFSYYWVGKNETTYKGSIYDVMDNNLTFNVAPDTTTTIIAEFASSRFGEAARANGQAKIIVKPVEYIYDQTLSSINSAYLHASDGFKTGQELDVRNQGANWDRIAFIEFDLSTINTLEDKNKYIFRFWLTRSHAQSASAGPGIMEIKSITGEIDPIWTWATQPADANMELISLEPFNATSTSEQIKFEADITGFVRSSLEIGSNKIIIRVNETKSKGLYYIGGHTYPEENKRPRIDVRLRREI